MWSLVLTLIAPSSSPLPPSDVPDIVCQEYAVPHMQTLIPQIPGNGYMAPVSTGRGPPPLNSIFPRPPAVPPPPTSEKYYAATAICKANGNTMGHGGGLAAAQTVNPSFSNAKTLPLKSVALNNLGSSNGGPQKRMVHSPSVNISGAEEEQEALFSSGDEDCQVQEFPRQSLTIVEKLGSGQFGDFHICETLPLDKGSR